MTEKKFMLSTLKEQGMILASHNQGKLRELQAAFSDDGISISSAAELQLAEPEETASTFEGNARLKAEAALAASGQPCLADDSGLSVKALNGAPGLYSARWAGPDRDYGVAFNRIIDEMTEIGRQPEGAEAAFVCVLVLLLPKGELVVAEGRIEGKLTFPPKGNGGFGYDPVFIPHGEDRTFGEMTPEEKSRFSHRQQAVSSLRQKLGLL